MSISILCWNASSWAHIVTEMHKNSIWNSLPFVYFFWYLFTFWSQTRISYLALLCQFLSMLVFFRTIWLICHYLFQIPLFIFFKWLAAKETWIFKLFPWTCHSVQYLKDPFCVWKCWGAEPPKMAYQKDSLPTYNFIWLFLKSISTIYIEPKYTTDVETVKLRKFICKYQKNNKSL